VSPLYFFPEKYGDLFLLIAVTITIAFYCFHSGVPLQGGVSPFLPVRPRFSAILCKFAHKKFFPSGVTPWRVSPGAVRTPRILLVTPLRGMHMHARYAYPVSYPPSVYHHSNVPCHGHTLYCFPISSVPASPIDSI